MNSYPCSYSLCLCLLQEKFSVRPHYLENSEVNGRMRGILIDWLVQVHLRFHLLQETLYLTVAIIDRFLQVINIIMLKVQLIYPCGYHINYGSFIYGLNTTLIATPTIMQCTPIYVCFRSKLCHVVNCN